MDEYIVYLDDMSGGAFELATHSRLTHIYPFISSVAAVGDSVPIASAVHVRDAVKVTRVAVKMDSVRKAVKLREPNVRFPGKGVSVAVIDTGLSPHLDFFLPNRIPVFVDLVGGKTEAYDDNGHGTSVAGALAGSGLMSDGRYSGIAPGVNIIPVKALGANGEGSTSDILQAMQWVWTNCDKYNIRVVCMSFGAGPQGKTDPLARGAEALHSRGVLVVASSGNDGPEEGTVKSPGISPFALTVGGTEAKGEMRLSPFSSRGVYGGIRKPDVVAPAEDIICTGSAEDYVTVSGTSIATPIVAGACALVFAARPSYTPDKVRQLIAENARPMTEEGSGSGLIDMSFVSLL